MAVNELTEAVIGPRGGAETAEAPRRRDYPSVVRQKFHDTRWRGFFGGTFGDWAAVRVLTSGTPIFDPVLMVRRWQDLGGVLVLVLKDGT